MSLQKLMNRIFGILQVGELASARWADFAARSRQSIRDPVIAERAFLGGIGLRIDEPASVGASLHAITAAKAVLLVDQDNTIWRNERCPYWTHLGAGRICTVVTQLRDEEVLSATLFVWRETLLAAVR